MQLKYIFGPVPSRRLGVSAGIDLIPFKTCTLNCVYCECGETTSLLSRRKEYVPVREVVEELNQFLKSNPDLDYITFSGSGEPTMHSKIGDIIKFLKKNYPKYKVALLTNGTLFYNNQKLIAEMQDIDLIVPSLDAVSEDIFEKINRPYQGITSTTIIQGLIQLRENYKGQLWLEIFIIPGINDSINEISCFKEAIDKIKPNKVQLNTLDRPGTEKWIQPASPEKLQEIKEILGEKVKVISKFKSKKNFSTDIKDNIIETLKRRPFTKKDLSETLGINQKKTEDYIQKLMEKDKIKIREGNRGSFYYLED